MPEDTASQHAERRAWFTRQLNEAGWTHEVTPNVRYIVDQFLGMGIISTHFGTQEFELALDIVHDLLNERALVDSHRNSAPAVADDDTNVTWLRVQPGYVLNRQDRVRVSSDAYDGELAMQHNGRTGSIMDVRYGMAVVHYDGEPPGTGHHHSIRLLEKRLQAPVQ